MRGRKPKPPATHRNAGTFREDRHGDTFEPPAGCPSFPKWLSDPYPDERREMENMLVAGGAMSEVDGLMWGLLWQAVDDYMAARKEVEEGGLISVSKTGAEYQNPAVGIANKAFERVAKLAARFGMTPVDRASIKATPPQSGKTDGKSRFFKAS